MRHHGVGATGESITNLPPVCGRASEAMRDPHVQAPNANADADADADAAVMHARAAHRGLVWFGSVSFFFEPPSPPGASLLILHTTTNYVILIAFVLLQSLPPSVTVPTGHGFTILILAHHVLSVWKVGTN
jgi:hypothetical protein